MTSLQFILRGLKHHRTGYLGVLLGSALGTMVLLGALFAGDSVKSTLRQIAEQRTGKTKLILAGGESLFTSDLASRLDNTTAPVLQLRGQVDEPSGRSTGQVDLFGVTNRFWSFAPEKGGIQSASPMAHPEVTTGSWAINQELARSLDLAPGDTLILRLRKPGLISSDAPLADGEDEIITLRGKASRILADNEMGRFSLESTQLPAPKVFLPLETLAEAIGHPGRANLLLFRSDDGTEGLEPDGRNLGEVRSRISEAATLADYGLSIKEVPETGHLEIRSESIFIKPAIESKILEAFSRAKPTLTYLVNTIATNNRETPYSMVTGTDPTLTTFLPNDLKDNEIVLNSWEAEDLAAKPGDTVKITYYVLSKQNTLTEEHAEFTVRSIIPLEGPAADKLWVPDFPGIAEAEDSVDWESGLPLDTTRIRDKDETYWDEHRATPKAFITHSAAAKLWQNRWGSSTGLRFAIWDLPKESLEQGILATLTPADAGLHIQNIAAEAERAAASPVDIASLFLSMSFFLIVAAVALTAMLFRFNVEQRNTESGLLSALGISAKRILHWRLAEGLVVITLGAILGAALAFAYTRGLLLFLEKIWSTGGERLFIFHASPASVIGGVIGFVILMMATIWFTTRKQARQAASLRLTAGTEEIPPVRKSSRARLIAIISALIGLGSLAAAKQLGPSSAFFLSGFAFLIAGLAVWSAGLQAASSTPILTPPRLARLNLSRRPTRSLVAIGTLASAIFLVISVTAFQKHASADWQNHASGTGGYGLWIETTSPLTRLPSGKFEFQDDTIKQLLPIRVGSGDDASCFNLNSVAQPRLLATDTSALEAQSAFTIQSTAEGLDKSWASLRTGPRQMDRGLVPPTKSGQSAPEHEQPSPNAAQPPSSLQLSNSESPITGARSAPIRAFIDETTLLWVLKKKLGDTIDYTDDQGNTFPVLIAGTLTESVFQGSFIVDEQAFLERFPSSPGYRLFLATTDKPPAEAIPDLQRSLTDLGATITPTFDRLAAFHSVENTYISIFNVLGGLGVILGSAGLGLLTARNLAERRGEFAMLNTIGISKKVIRKVLVRETSKLILGALVIGLVAAAVSIAPSLPKQSSPLTTLAWIVLLAALIITSASFAAMLAYFREMDRKSPRT